jgi:hypothetical protein
VLLGVATDAAGEFSVAVDPKVASSAYLQAYSDDCVSMRCGPVKPGTYQILQLLDASSIEGTVTDKAGNVISDAYVVAVPDSSDKITLLAHDRCFWMPGDTIDDGTQTVTSGTGAFVMRPVLPGRYALKVYLRSCASGYPAAEAEAYVEPGRTLRTRLVVDTSGFGAIQGTVLVGGSPLPGAQMIARPVSKSDEWLNNISTRTDDSGWYTFGSIRPGAVSVVLQLQGQNGDVERQQAVDLAAGQTATVDFTLDGRSAGIEGTISMDGSHESMYQVTVAPVDSDKAEDAITMYVDFDGKYRVTDLQERQYLVKVEGWPRGSVYASATVAVKNGEMARQDFNLAGGTVGGTVVGLGANERAVVAVFSNATDLAALTTFSPEVENEIIASAEVIAGQSFSLKLPAGTYYMGAVAVPMEGKPDQAMVLSGVTKGRYEIVQIEVAAGQATTADIGVGGR